MKVYIVECRDNDFYADFQFKKVFQRLGDARTFCNKQILAELEEAGITDRVHIEKDNVRNEYQMYYVTARRFEQTLKLTTTGDWYRQEVYNLTSEYRVCITNVE